MQMMQQVFHIIVCQPFNTMNLLCPANGGRKKDYTSFAAVQADIDEIIKRVNLNPGERGFMPFKGNKLSDSTIAVFTKWKADGLLEK